MQYIHNWWCSFNCSVADPDPNLIRIHVFLGLLDPDPDPLVRGMDPNPDPLVRGMDPDPDPDPDLDLLTLSKKNKKNLDFSCFVLLFTEFCVIRMS
jgi:hypothetical protein